MAFLRLNDIIGSVSAISPRHGKKAYDSVSDRILKSESVTVSFDGMKDCSSAFFNSFVGKLYMNFEPSKLDRLLCVQGLDQNHIWRKKFDNARLLGTNENVRTTRRKSIDNLFQY